MTRVLPKPKKRLGQHFLTDRHYIDRIVSSIAPALGEHMVEIGPGPGALTAPLTALLDHLHVVEVDRELAATLRETYPPSQVTVHEADALAFDFASLPAPLRITGNLPYNISTPLLFHIADFTERIVDCTFMLQKEVVDRMVAAPDAPDYGRLSVMLQYRFAMRRLFLVPPGAFHPPPKVDSAIVRMMPLGVDRLQAKDDERFGAIVQAAFGQRRKMLRNTLKSMVNPSAFEQTGIDSQRRAETLSVAEFVALSDAT